MKPTVVFLHGMARTHRSLAGLRLHVANAGYSTWARTYPSRRMPLGELAAEVAGWIRRDVGGPVVAVTHSLGGILARHMNDLVAWHSVVMLAPPNAGSRVAARLLGHPLYRWFYGPAGQQLARAGDWPQLRAPVAVIAGTRGASLGNVPSWVTAALALLPRGEPSDGTVTVAETRLPEMAAFAEVDASHTWLMDHPQTRRLVLEFLATGRFL